MSLHRTKCRNALCGFEGMMEAKAEASMMKKALLDKKLAGMKSKGIAPPPGNFQVRCPKCGARWRMRADQLR